jgi:hypothetical protein
LGGHAFDGRMQVGAGEISRGTSHITHDGFEHCYIGFYVSFVLRQCAFQIFSSFRKQADRLHSIQRETEEKVAGNLVGNGVVKYWRGGLLER